jgi:hypothetical protein
MLTTFIQTPSGRAGQTIHGGDGNSSVNVIEIGAEAGRSISVITTVWKPRGRPAWPGRGCFQQSISHPVIDFCHHEAVHLKQRHLFFLNLLPRTLPKTKRFEPLRYLTR